MSDAHAQMRREMQERQFRMQDSHERKQFAVADQLFQTEEALSNRVRIFGAAVLAVSWGLLIGQADAETASAFDFRLIFAASTLSVISLLLDFGYWNFRSIALRTAYRKGIGAIGGAGWAVPFMRLSGILRAIMFFGATGVLIAAAVGAFWPRLSASAGFGG